MDLAKSILIVLISVADSLNSDMQQLHYAPLILSIGGIIFGETVHTSYHAFVFSSQKINSSEYKK